MNKRILFLTLDCKEYSILVKQDAYILHGDCFDDQLAFYKVLLENGCYGLYRLKCLKIQFSLWKIKSQIKWNDAFYFIYLLHL